MLDKGSGGWSWRMLWDFYDGLENEPEWKFTRLDSKGLVDPQSLSFASDFPNSEAETLYVFGNDGHVAGAANWLVSIPDLDTMEPEIVGAMPPIEHVFYGDHYEVADLSGTGDAKIWAFFWRTKFSPSLLADVNIGSAQFDDEWEPVQKTGGAWTLAQWGGALWLFTATTDQGLTQVTRVDLDSKEEEIVVEDLGVRITGAAVSTCAPWEPPG